MSNQQKNKKLALQFVWLLRSDLRQGLSVLQQPTPYFGQWWLLQGRAEYPAWNKLESSEHEWLAQRTIPFRLAEYELKLPRAFGLVMKLRNDVRAKFTQDNKVDQAALLAWFLMMGLKEHALEQLVTQDLIKDLDCVPQDSATQFLSSAGKLLVPRPTVLMHLIWHLLDAEVKKSMALNEDVSRDRYFNWFFCVAVKKYQIEYLLAPRWRYWLLQEIPVMEGVALEIPRFAIYEQRLSSELKEQFPLDSIDSIQKLSVWSKKQLTDKSDWSWLKSQTARPTAVPATLETSMPVNKKEFGINLFGFAFGELGIGEDLRMAVAACEAAKIPYRIVNINAGNLRQADDQLKQEVSDSLNQAPYSVNLFCMPAFDMVSRIFLKMGSTIFENHYNVGWWPWELSTWPKAWKSAFELIDEVWAGSQFTLSTYQKNTLKPCFHVPLAVSVDRVQTFTRKHFGIPKNTYTYLYILDFNSSLKRKNPIALIHAFSEAFLVSDKSVALIFKVMNVQEDHPTWSEFKQLCSLDPRIKILNQTMDRPEVLGLIKACDVYVSPHCAEGFGRTLAEAMLFGKPVIATNYSGNTDFMDPRYTFPVNYELVPVLSEDYHFIETDDGAEWAQVSVSELAKKMRMAKDSSKKVKLREDIQTFANSQFNVERTAKIMKERLTQIKKQLI